MDCHQVQYAQLKQDLLERISLTEFETRLTNSELIRNPCYLGLLLMHIVTLKQPQIPDYLRILISYGANVNFTEPKQPSVQAQSRKSIFMLACEKGQLRSVLFLLKQQELNVGAEDSLGENALFYILKNDEDTAVNIILPILSNFPHLVDSVSKQKDKTLLTVVAEQGYSKLTEILLKKSADPNFQSEISGNTTLHWLLRNDSMDERQIKSIVKLLLKYKANPKIQNHQCQTCQDIADTYLFDLETLVVENETQEMEWKEIKIETHSIITATKDEENQSHHNFEEESEFSFSDDEFCEETINTQTLNKQIWTHCVECEAVHQSAWNQISNFVNQLALIGHKHELTLEIIGSFATGLWTPYSDIDLTFINNNMMYVNILNLLREIYQMLRRRMKELGIYEIYLNDQLKFPNIKIELTSRLHSRKIDITIFQKKNNARKYVQYIQNALGMNNMIKPIFFTVHRLLEGFDLHRPMKSGLKTYTIFLMILMVVEQYPANEVGQLFLNFIDYYTNYYKYEENISEKGEITKRLSIVDPLNNLNNAGGKDTNIDRLEMMFRIVFYGLQECGNQPLSYLFQLHNITNDDF